MYCLPLSVVIVAGTQERSSVGAKRRETTERGAERDEVALERTTSARDRQQRTERTPAPTRLKPSPAARPGSLPLATSPVIATSFIHDSILQNAPTEVLIRAHDTRLSTMQNKKDAP